MSVEKVGVSHDRIGRVGFTTEQLLDDGNELLGTLVRMKASSAKGIYMKSVVVCSTMSPGIKIDPKTIA